MIFGSRLGWVLGGLRPVDLKPGRIGDTTGTANESERKHEKQNVSRRASAAGRKETAPQSSVENSREDQRILMTRGEFIFCLRDVPRVWSTPCLSCHDSGELEQKNLIERSTTGIRSVRLTGQGAPVTNWQQLKAP